LGFTAEMQEETRVNRVRVDLSRYDSVSYAPGGVVKRALWYLTSLVFFETLIPWPSRWKASILRLFGAVMGTAVVIKPQVKIKYPWFLAVGDHAWIGEGVWVDNPAQVTIGAQAVISQGAYLLSGNHDYRAERFDLKLAPVVIGDGAWVCAKAVIAPGCEVGREAVIGLGAVLSSDADPNAVYAGNPAARIRERFPV